MPSSEQPKRISNHGRAVIVRGDSVLLLEFADGPKSYWAFPGGHQEFGETMAECAVRECREELGCEVAVERCLMVRELIGDRLTEAVGNVRGKHFFELFFLARALTEPDLTVPDPMHRSAAWVEIDRLKEIGCLPKTLASNLRAIIADGGAIPLYVGHAE